MSARKEKYLSEDVMPKWDTESRRAEDQVAAKVAAARICVVVPDEDLAARVNHKLEDISACRRGGGDLSGRPPAARERGQIVTNAAQGDHSIRSQRQNDDMTDPARVDARARVVPVALGYGIIRPNQRSAEPSVPTQYISIA